jgi:hypothetical protein
MNKLLIVSIVVLLSITSCNLPQGQNNPVATATTQMNSVATAVAATMKAKFSSTGTIKSPSIQTPSLTNIPLTVTTTLTPTVTVTPENTATPTITMTVEDFKSSLGPPTWKDSFETSTSFFQKGINSYEDDHTRIGIANGVMTLSSFTSKNWLGWRLTYPLIKNFYLEAEFRPKTCSGKDQYGLVYRAPDYESGFGFYLAFSCDGQYNLTRLDDGGTVTVINWTSSADILSGSDQTNRMGILAAGSDFSFYANGKKIKEVTDSHLESAGHFGPFISYSDTPNFTYDMDNITYWIMP